MPPRLTPEDVNRVARKALGIEISGITPLRPGAWSTVYSFVAGADRYVIRFSALREDFERDRFARAFRSPVLPIPRVVAIGAYGDLYYAVSEHIPGGFLDDTDEDGMDRHLPSLLAALNAMRTADTSSTSGFGIWDESGNAPCQTFQEFLASVEKDSPGQRDSGWSARLAASPLGSGPFTECFREMTSLFDRIPNHRHVVHSDLLNFNVLVSDGAISGVIDWGCAFYGDHLYDVAWFAFWAPWYPQWRDLDLSSRMLSCFRDAGANMVNAEQRLRCYMLHIGLGQMRYSASIERWDHLQFESRRALSIAHGYPFTLNENV